MPIPVPQHLTNGWSVVREDWRVVLWTVIIAGIAWFASMVVVLPMLAIGFIGVGAAAAAESTALTVIMIAILGIFFLVVIFLMAVAIQALMRAGVIGVLRARKPGMVTDFGTFWAYARTGFKSQFRAHVPGWVLWIPYLLIMFGVLAVVFIFAGGVEAFENEASDAAGIAAALIMLAFFGLSLLMLPLQIIITYGTKYGAYVMHDNPTMGGWAAFKKGLRFFGKNFWAAIGLSLLFLLVLFGVSTALQVLLIPVSLLGAIPVVGAILSIPVSLLVSFASIALQSAVMVWEEQASLNLYDDRKEA